MTSAKVAVVMGSDSDLPTMQAAVDLLTEFGVAAEVAIISAHRTPQQMMEFATNAAAIGFQIIINQVQGTLRWLAPDLPLLIPSPQPKVTLHPRLC